MKVFDQFRLDTVNQCLWRGQARVPMAPKAFDLLRYLVENSDRLVTQEEILEALWPETYVNPEGVRKYILDLRKVLGDRTDQPLFIQTLPKRGYQFIAEIKEDRGPADSASAPPSIMVGRGAALAEMGSLRVHAAAGRRQVAFVTGEAGMGKTTLVDAFVRQTEHIPGTRIVRGQCIEGFGGKEAYYPLLEALGGMLRGHEGSALVELLAKRAPSWLVQFPSLIEPGRRESLQREIMGGTRERMVREICEALESFTAQSPLIVVLEDLHWVDDSTLDVISALARRREPAKLLLIGTYRPVEVVLANSPLKALKQDLRLRNLCHEIAVERLEKAEIAESLDFEFAPNRFPADLARLIYTNSGGNPLFMRAIVDDIVKRGWIASDEGTWVLTASVTQIYPGIPETLQQMLESQIERLGAEDRRMLQAASVAGERFSAWAAGGMVDSAETAAEELLDGLAQRLQFIRFAGVQKTPLESDSAHFEFRHSLYRQALYRSLSASTRVKLHRTLADRLMPVCNAGRRELATEIALHYEQGRDYGRAAHCLVLASENAASKFSQKDSIRALQDARSLAAKLEPVRQPPLEVQILQRLGDACCAAGDMAEALPAYEKAAATAASAGLQEAQVEALLALAFPVYYSDVDEGRRICERALAACAGTANPLLSAQTQMVAASYRLLYDTWNKEDEETFERSRNTVLRLTGSPVIHHLFDSHILAFQGAYDKAVEDSRVKMQTTQNPTEYMLAFGVDCMIEQYRGNCGEVLERVRAGKELARRNATDPWMWNYGEGWLHLLCLDFEGAARLAEADVRREGEPGVIWIRTMAFLASGYAELFRGNLEQARQYFDRVRDFRVTPKYFLHWQWRMRAEMGTAEALLKAGDIANANRESDLFFEHALSTADPALHLLAWDLRARVAAAEKDPAAALRHIEKAVGLSEKFKISAIAWPAHSTAAHLYAQAGDADSAAKHRRRAVEMIQHIAGSFAPEEPIRQAFLGSVPVRLTLGSEFVTSA